MRLAAGVRLPQSDTALDCQHTDDRHPTMRRTAFALSVFCLTLPVTHASGQLAPEHRETDSTVEVRIGPGSEYPSARTLHEGARVHLRGCAKAWCLVGERGQMGYVPYGTLRRVDKRWWRLERIPMAGAPRVSEAFVLPPRPIPDVRLHGDAPVRPNAGYHRKREREARRMREKPEIQVHEEKKRWHSIRDARRKDARRPGGAKELRDREDAARDPDAWRRLPEYGPVQPPTRAIRPPHTCLVPD